MWQRIQTLYLLIAAGLVAVLAFGTKAVRFVVENGETVRETVAYAAYWPYLVLTLLLGALHLLALTTYKIRVFQMRTAALSALIALALQVWLGVDYFTADDQVVFRFTAVFPFLIAILDLLAARAIAMDEAMVQSASRLRSARRR